MAHVVYPYNKHETPIGNHVDCEFQQQMVSDSQKNETVTLQILLESRVPKGRTAGRGIIYFLKE